VLSVYSPEVSWQAGAPGPSVTGLTACSWIFGETEPHVGRADASLGAGIRELAKALVVFFVEGLGITAVILMPGYLLRVRFARGLRGPAPSHRTWPPTLTRNVRDEPPLLAGGVTGAAAGRRCSGWSPTGPGGRRRTRP
jgi:hypothetical protein